MLKGGIQAEVLLDGAGCGPFLRLDAPLSFWGGIDPASGRISDPRRSEHGRSIAGCVLALPATIGSSSSSAVMLELITVRRAPAALILGGLDAILTLGVVVAREMGHPGLPVLRLSADAQRMIPEGCPIAIAPGGWISWADEGTRGPAVPYAP